MNPDCSTYRSGVLAGRTQALREMSDLISQLALKVEPEHGPEVTMGSLVSNWLEVVAWLNQAETEVADELTLLEASANA